MMNKQRLIQLIHIARSDLQMDEDTYRQMLQGLTGKASTKGMDISQLNRVMESMKSKGFRVKPAGKAKSAIPMDSHPSRRKFVHSGWKWRQWALSATVQNRRWRYGFSGKRASVRYDGSAMNRQVALLRN